MSGYLGYYLISVKVRCYLHCVFSLVLLSDEEDSKHCTTSLTTGGSAEESASYFERSSSIAASVKNRTSKHTLLSYLNSFFPH